ncbi:MAG TPA: hypothetical protein VL262_04145 [Vicinamibacterales bacterium]|jgi:uncharacterized membrane protein|nr:hypothetical protein [Vicinamibacterales bacterium]
MSDSRAKIWFALFVLAVFCVGGATGVVIGRRLGPPLRPERGFFGFGRGAMRGPGPAGFPPPEGRGGAPLPPDLVNRLTRDLQLDGTQQVELRKILDNRRSRLEQVHREAREKFEQEQRELHQAIRGILRPDQQQAFDHFTERRP